MTSTQLRTEIASGPLAAELAPLVAAGNHAGIVAVLNLPRTSMPIPCVVSRTLVINKLIAVGALPALLASADPAAVQTRYVLDHPDYATLDLADPVAEAMMQGLEAAGVVNAAQVAAVQALGSRPGSRMEQVDGSGVAVTLDEVSAALE